jgi:uncharacterized membrane protein
MYGVEMDLSPEQRRKIYEEEKVRIEAAAKLAEEKQRTEAAPTVNIEPNVAGLLCYIGFWLTGIIFLVIEQRNRFVRFHAIQSIFVFGTLTIASAVLNQISVAAWFFDVIVGVLSLVLWIVLMVKAYQGYIYKIPLAGDLAEKVSGVSYVKYNENIQATNNNEYTATPTPTEPPSARTYRTSDKQMASMTDDYSRRAKADRITSSSVAITWSVIFLILLNFFSRYIAYYQLETVNDVTKWVRYPILTEDFNAWLPIVTTMLIVSIIGHIILVIFDRYILREATLIVLNSFGVVTILALFSIFPFDFGVIPNSAIADSLPIIATIVFIAIALGLGIATLVRFIKLIISVAMGNRSY